MTVKLWLVSGVTVRKKNALCIDSKQREPSRKRSSRDNVPSKTYRHVSSTRPKTRNGISHSTVLNNFSSSIRTPCVTRTIRTSARGAKVGSKCPKHRHCCTVTRAGERLLSSSVHNRGALADPSFPLDVLLVAGTTFQNQNWEDCMMMRFAQSTASQMFHSSFSKCLVCTNACCTQR